VGWEAVFHTVRWLLEDTPSQPPALGAGVGGYISGFDADGYLHFVPFAKAQLDRVTLLRLSYREAWKVLLDGKPLEQASAAVNREIQDHYHGEGGREAIAEIPDEVLPAFEQLHALARQGIACSQALLQEATRQPCSVERLHALSQALGALDEQIRVLGATGDGLRPLTAMFRFGKENLQGWELLPLAQQTLSLYETLAQQTEVTSRVLAAIDIGGRHATDIHRWAGVHSRS